MRKGAIILLAAVALVWISTHETAHAQEMSPTFTVGGGLGIPIDAEGINNGQAIRGGVSLPVYQNLHAVLEGHYSKNSAEEDPSLPPGLSPDFKLIGANLGVMLRSSSSISVYGQGGIGITRAEGTFYTVFPVESVGTSVSDSETVFSFTVGGGVHIPINPSIGVAIDARYSHTARDIEATKLMPITVSIVFSP